MNGSTNRVIHKPEVVTAQPGHDDGMSIPPDHHLARTVLTTVEALEGGLTPQMRRTLLTHGCLVSPLRGFYAPKNPEVRCTSARHARQLAVFDELPIDPLSLPRLRAYVLRSLSVARHLGPSVAVSGPAAAALHGMPVVLPSSTSLPRSETSGRARRPSHKKGDIQHRSPLAQNEVRHVGGMSLTSHARTLADIAANHPVVTALAIADHLLRNRLLDRADMERALANHPSRRTRELDPSVPAFASRHAESPGESWCRLELYRAGLPTPCEQVRICDDSGTFIGRVDFAWPELGIILEFDGAVKYKENGSKALFQEKRREDALRALGWTVVRCVWSDLSRFDHVAAEIRRHAGADAVQLRGMALDPDWNFLVSSTSAP